jgi:hypothetical protein
MAILNTEQVLSEQFTQLTNELQPEKSDPNEFLDSFSKRPESMPRACRRDFPQNTVESRKPSGR